MPDLAFECPACHTKLKSSVPAQSGKLIKCSSCGALLSAPTGRSERAGPSSRRRLELPKNGTSSSHRKRKPPLRLRPPSDDMGAAGMHRRLQRQAEAIQEVSREVAQEDARRLAEEAARLRRKQRRQEQAVKKKRMLAGLAAIGLVGLLLAALAVAGVLRSLHVKSSLAQENHGTGNEDLFAYVPADSILIAGFTGERLPVQLREGLVNAIRNQWGSGSFLRDTQTHAGVPLRDLLNETVIAVSNGSTPSLTLIGRSKVPFSQQNFVSAASIPEFQRGRSGDVSKIKGASFPARLQRDSNRSFFKVDVRPFTTLYMPSDEIIVLTSAPEEMVFQIVAANGRDLTLPKDTVEQIATIRESGCWLVVRVQGGIGDSLRQQLSTRQLKPPEAWHSLLTATDQVRWFRAAVADNFTRMGFELVMADEESVDRVSSPFAALFTHGQQQANIQAAASLTSKPASNQSPLALKVFSGLELDKKESSFLMITPALKAQELGTICSTFFEYLNGFVTAGAPNDPNK